MIKKKKRKTKKEKLSLSDKLDQLPWWIPGCIFLVIILTLHFTTEIGVGYYFLAMIAAGLIMWIMGILILFLGKHH